ncbi:NAD(P)/FAD-dependent oxidoreductase [Nisaea sp.]|uniref:flavin-containing monooxygenase n=1 Tax=Nisaea sp. TaxID=2024842 RepID=UPI0032EAB37A
MNRMAEPDVTGILLGWIAGLNAALTASDAGAVADCFDPDGYWRDVLILSGRQRTIPGDAAIAGTLLSEAARAGLGAFSIADNHVAPRIVERAGSNVIEGFLSFETDKGIGVGLIRLKHPADRPRAWIFMTALEDLKGFEEARLFEQRDEPAFNPSFHGPNWLDKRQNERAYADRDPEVLIVGGGHAGLTVAARLNRLDVDTLVVDRMKRVGDNWRLRYHGLKLHNYIHSNHLPYMPFPEGWPTYIPKDRIANWLESYVDAMDINFWTETSFESAEYDEQAGCWIARMALADGSVREMRPRHIVMATSVSGTPNIPEIPTLDRFKGPVLHSSQFTAGADWKGKRVTIFGTGTSAHDIAQDLEGNGAAVTIVQRSPTLIVNIEPSAQLYDGIYWGEGPSWEDRDLINMATPFDVVRIAHKIITDKVKEIDRPLLDGLEKVGFRLDFGEGGTGWPLKYRTRGGGYYFNVGASDLMAAGRIGLIQNADIAHFEAGGLRMKDGTPREADLVVLATGYKGQDHMTRVLFGDAVADRVGTVWDIDPEIQELNNMWTPTPQPGLWYTGGSFAQARIYSKFLARAIKGELVGVGLA